MKKNIVPLILLVATLVLIIGLYVSTRTPCRAVRDTSVLIVGTNAEYAPFSFMQDGKIVGFDIDIAHEVARRLGKQIQLIDMPFDMLLPKLQLGDIQLIAAGITQTPERSKHVLFTKPHLTQDPLLIVSKKTAGRITSVADLTNKNVVVNDGYTADTYVSSLVGPIVHRLATPAEAILALRSGRADAYVTARSAIKPFFDIYGDTEFQVAEIPGQYDNYSLVISSYYPELVTSIQQALEHMQQDGTLNTLIKKWNIR